MPLSTDLIVTALVGDGEAETGPLATSWHSQQPSLVQPYWHYQNEPETRKALDLIFSDHFGSHEPGIFEPLRGALLTHGDHMHLADLTSYLHADGRLCDLYRRRAERTQTVIFNIAGSGKFSSDRTIAEYAQETWG